MTTIAHLACRHQARRACGSPESRAKSALPPIFAARPHHGGNAHGDSQQRGSSGHLSPLTCRGAWVGPPQRPRGGHGHSARVDTQAPGLYASRGSHTCSQRPNTGSRCTPHHYLVEILKLSTPHHARKIPGKYPEKGAFPFFRSGCQQSTV